MIFSETQLVELDKIFRDHLQEHDKGIANLGILLISDVRKGRLALTAANKPLEALAEQMKSKPFSEISEGVQDQLLMAVHEVETVLDSHICNRPPSDINDHLEICHIDPRACEESLETKEYFQCHVNGETNIFKFTLHPQTGVFQLHTYLIKKSGFWGRLWHGIRYIFGYQSKNGDWDSVSIDREMTERLHRLTNEALDTMSDTANRKLHAIK
jgi:hypothetical protein